MFDYEKSQKNRELWQKYHSLQDKVEELYRENAYTSAKRVCLEVLGYVDALRETGEFDYINKPFAEYAIIMSTLGKLDENDRRILKLIFSKKVMTLQEIIPYLSFDPVSLAEPFFQFLVEIGVLSEKEADDLISNVHENDGEIVLIDPETEAKRKAGLESVKKLILDFLITNQPILQKDFLAAFKAANPDPWPKDVFVGCGIQDIFRMLVDEGKIRREKAGRSFNLFVNNS